MENLTDSEMIGVYRAISVEADDDVDANEEIEFVYNTIQIVFDKQFLMIENTVLQQDKVILNNKFAELLKYCIQNNYKKYGWIFLGFCDFFDLDCCIIFNQLHEKIQKAIKHGAIQICGKTVYANSLKKNQEHPTLHIPTVFQIGNK